MPLGRYLLFVGGVLIALLFLAEPYFPRTATQFENETQVDTSMIRIKSARKWPEKIVYDTNHPTIVPLSLPLTAEASVVSNIGRGSLAQTLSAPTSEQKTPDKQVKRKFASRRQAPRIAGYREPKLMRSPRATSFAMTGTRWGGNEPADTAPARGTFLLDFGRPRFGG